MNLNEYSSIKEFDYKKCIDSIEHGYVINGVEAKVRLHYLKFNGNGEPMVKALAETLYTYIIDYCISLKHRDSDLSASQYALMVKEARSLFRRPEVSEDNPDKTGEAGEMLLYFLMESVLKAPQVVCKMELKTNSNDEVKGSDGIHAKYCPDDQIVDFYFGESKLYQESSRAISDAIKSIKSFHDNEMYRHEFNLVTRNFKFAQEETRESIKNMIVAGEPGEDVRVNHACLIGYDFKGFWGLSGETLDDKKKDFLEKFLLDGERLTNLLQKNLDKFDKKYLLFDVFFLPFPSVSDFRNYFNEALS